MDPDDALTRSQRRTARLRGAASRKVGTSGFSIQTPKSSSSAAVKEKVRRSGRRVPSSTGDGPGGVDPSNDPVDTPTVRKGRNGGSSKKTTRQDPGPSTSTAQPAASSSSSSKNPQRQETDSQKPKGRKGRSRKGKEPMPAPTPRASRKRRAGDEPPVEKMPPPPEVPKTAVRSRKGKEPMYPQDRERLTDLRAKKKKIRAMMALFRYGLAPELQESLKEQKKCIIPIYRAMDEATIKARKEKAIEKARQRNAEKLLRQQQEAAGGTIDQDEEAQKKKEEEKEKRRRERENRPQQKVRLRRMDIILFVVRQQMKIMRDRIRAADEYSLKSRRTYIKILNHLEKQLILKIANRQDNGKKQAELKKSLQVIKTQVTKKQNHLLQLRQQRIDTRIEMDELRADYQIYASQNRALQNVDQFLYDVDDLRKQQYHHDDDSDQAGPSDAPHHPTSANDRDPIADLLVKTTSILPLVSDPGFLTMLRNFNNHLESVEARLDAQAATKQPTVQDIDF